MPICGVSFIHREYCLGLFRDLENFGSENKLSWIKGSQGLQMVFVPRTYGRIQSEKMHAMPVGEHQLSGRAIHAVSSG